MSPRRAYHYQSRCSKTQCRSRCHYSCCSFSCYSYWGYCCRCYHCWLGSCSRRPSPHLLTIISWASKSWDCFACAAVIVSNGQPPPSGSTELNWCMGCSWSGLHPTSARQLCQYSLVSTQITTSSYCCIDYRASSYSAEHLQPDLIRVIFIATEIAAKLFASVRALKVWLAAGLSESMVEVV